MALACPHSYAHTPPQPCPAAEAGLAPALVSPGSSGGSGVTQALLCVICLPASQHPLLYEGTKPSQ